MQHYLMALIVAVVGSMVLPLQAEEVSATAPKIGTKPNIVLIYVDDLGYGDIGCNGATRVKTPHIDRLASEGLNFTDGHSPSATCTPSRYAMLTGEYAWRKKGTGVLPGDAKLIIEPGRRTLATTLQQAGYHTGVVGKWHLGLGDGNLDWNGPIQPGPLQIGFDESFIMAATGDRVPCVYVDQDRVLNLDPSDPIRVQFGKPLDPSLPTGKSHPELLTVMKPSHGHDMTIVNGVSRIGYMTGGKSALWNDQEMADVFTSRALQFLDDHQAKKSGQPFFLFFSLHDIHVPRLPHPRFVGSTEMGPRGDVIVEMDWCVGQVLEKLKTLGVDDNTLVIFTSDNGPVVDDGYIDEAVTKLGDHRPAGPWRGGKYSAYEAGTRVPFITRWPGKIPPGKSNALVCQIDFLASLGQLAGQAVPEDEREDSEDVLPALLGQSPQGRETLVEHAGVLSLRQGTWKMIEPGKGPKVFAQTNTETGQLPQPRLFNLEEDPGETKDVAEELPEKVKELEEMLKGIRAAP
ncbi:MAG: arylsulfatase [Planctomyces sp.]|nr:arylsulfatase [Planctomyces sp.]